MQVAGRADLNFEDRLAFDMEYIRHYSIWKDFKNHMEIFRGHFVREGCILNHCLDFNSRHSCWAFVPLD